MLAEEEAVEAAGEMVEAVGVAMLAFERTEVAIGIGGRLEAEQVGHVVVGGLALAVGVGGVMPAGRVAAAGGHLPQEADHVLEEIAGHDGGRHRRIADHLARQHQAPRSAKISRRASGRNSTAQTSRSPSGVRDLDLELLVAVDGVEQHAARREPGFAPRSLR